MKARGSSSRPNFVLLVGEDTGRHHGCYGDPAGTTPNIDALAASGLRYTNACATGTVCAPSRAALVTGRYQWSFGAHHMRSTVCDPPRLFTQELRDAGYHVRWHSKLDFNFDPKDAPDQPWRDDDQPWVDRLARGDLHPSGPLWGRGGAPITEAERALVADEAALTAGLEQAGLKAERRALRLPVPDLEAAEEAPGVWRLAFSLPRGAFATTVVRELAETGSIPL
ncbi:MAG: tRNA pseudouridine(13) synthase TruD [Thiohalospira sp.]